MAFDTVTEDLDRYLSRAGAGGRETANGRPPRKRAQFAAAGKALTYANQTASNITGPPVDVAGPHQKCFLEGPSRLGPPSARLREFDVHSVTLVKHSAVIRNKLAMNK